MGHGAAAQIYLGDEDFVERMQALAEPQRATAREVPKAQRRKNRSLPQWLAGCGSREEALYKAYTESGLSISAIALEHHLWVLVARCGRGGVLCYRTL